MESAAAQVEWLGHNWFVSKYQSCQQIQIEKKDDDYTKGAITVHGFHIVHEEFGYKLKPQNMGKLR